MFEKRFAVMCMCRRMCMGMSMYCHAVLLYLRSREMEPGAL